MSRIFFVVVFTLSLFMSSCVKKEKCRLTVLTQWQTTKIIECDCYVSFDDPFVFSECEYKNGCVITRGSGRTVICGVESIVAVEKIKNSQ